MGLVGRVIEEAAEEWGLVLGGTAIDRLERYCGMILEARRALGLTGRLSEEELARYHVADALSCLLVMPESLDGYLVDIGSGAGLPGIVLKVARPGWQVVLVEAARRKAAFLEWVVRELGLRGITVVWERVENLGGRAEHAEAYSWAVARAVAPLDVLIVYSWPLLRGGGRLVAQKGRRVGEELNSAQEVLRGYGGRILGVKEVAVGERRRALVVVEKGKEFCASRGID